MVGEVVHVSGLSTDGKRQAVCFFFFSSRRRHTRFDCDWSSDVCSSDLSDLALLALCADEPCLATAKPPRQRSRRAAQAETVKSASKQDANPLSPLRACQDRKSVV